MAKFVVVLLLTVGTGSLWGLVVGQCTYPVQLPCHHCAVDGMSDVEVPLPQGSYLIWTCDTGYIMKGDGEMVVWVCGQNHTWLGPQPICTEVSCSGPPIPAHGSIRGQRQHSYPQGTSVFYKCDSGYSLIIKESSAKVTCDPDGEWTFSGAVCAIDCPDGYNEHSNVCFKDFPSISLFSASAGYSWETARQTCELEEEILALSKDSSTHAFLKSMTRDDSYWIGAREGRDWKWASDGSYVQRLFWNEGEPNGLHENCVELRNSTEGKFFWNDENCEREHGYICQADGPCTGGVDKLESSNATFNGMCYRFIGGNHTWMESKTACESKNYGSLVEILDLSTQEFLSSFASLLKSINFPEYWWIGVFEDKDDGDRSWFWVDNTRVTTSQWAENEPNDMGLEECIEMRENKDLQWNDEPCDTYEGYFCQRGTVACGDPGAPAHGERAPNNTSSFLDGATLHFRCDPGYQLNSSARITCLTNGSWDGARPFCQAVNCSGRPQKVDHANFTVTSRNFKAVTIYWCSDGFLPSAAPVSYCQADATWSTPNFSCSAIPTLPTSPRLTTGRETSRTLSKTAFLTSTLPTTLQQETTTFSQSLPLISVTAGTTVAVVVLIFALLAAAFVVLKRRNRQVVKAETIQYLEEQVGYHRTSANVYNLANYDVPSDLHVGETNHESGSHCANSAEICSHGNWGDSEDVMIDNELYIATVEHTC